MVAPTVSAVAQPGGIDSSTVISVEGTVLVLSGQEAAHEHDVGADSLPEHEEAAHDRDAGADSLPENDDHAVERTTLLPDEVRLVTADGASIELGGNLPEGLSTGDAFSGTVTIPADGVATVVDAVRKDLADAPAGALVDGESVLGARILAATQTVDLVLEVETSTVTPGVDRAEALAVIAPVDHLLDVVVVTLPAAPSAVVATDATIRTLVGRVSGFWNTQSAGQVRSLAVAGNRIHRVVSANACTPQLVWEDAAARVGTPSTSYWTSAARHLVVIAPKECGAGTGLATVGTGLAGGLVWVSYSDAVGETTLAHEIGHNFTLRHSNVQRCEASATCVDTEYNDYYDVMGAGITVNGVGNAQAPALNVTHKARIGALTETELAEVTLAPGLVAATTDHVVSPASAFAGVRGLKVTDPTDGGVYLVEYRSGTGMDAGSVYARSQIAGYAPGVRVLRLRADASSAVHTVAGTIATTRNAYLGAGRSFEAASRGFRLDVVGTGQAATVRVALARVLTTATPTIAGQVRVGGTLTANPGAWRPLPVQLGYQWLRAGSAIAGATAGTYVVGAADVGTTISVRVTGSKSDFASVGSVSAATATVPIPIQRFGGANRYASAAGISASYEPGVPVLYVATGTAYPDALSAAPAAAAAGGPLLLTAPTAVPAVVRTEIERLRPQKIVVVGGTGSVSASVYSDLSRLAPAIERLGGANRYASSRAIVDSAFGSTGVDRVYLATGRNFPDALSASAAAGAFDGAVILVDGLGTTLDAATVAMIRKLHPRDIVIAGGTGSVSAGIENAARSLGLPDGVSRAGGANRYATSRNISFEAFPAAGSVYIATGVNFPDALAGAPLAGKNRAPLYVVPGTCVPRAILADIRAFAPSKVVLLGGSGSVSTAVETLSPCAS